VYVQPTYYDPCSLTVMEAMACGLPVITTRMNGAAEPVGQGIEGLVMDDADRFEQLRAYMNRYADEGERAAAGRAARRLALRHTLDHQVEALLRVYRGEPAQAPCDEGVEPALGVELDDTGGE
jgi:UDP-glucose:(heptosyl)LPS alpha-1,3-glucosyltransferase